MGAGTWRDIGALYVCLIACGSGNPADTTEQQGGSSSDPDSEVAPTSNPETTADTNDASRDLSGTWDVLYSNRRGKVETLSVELSPTLLEFISDDDKVLALTDGETFDVAFDRDKVQGLRQSSEVASLGIMPLPLSGALQFAHVTELDKTCESSLTPDTFAFNCNNNVGGKIKGAKVTATKNSALPSSFGEIGGIWTVSSGKTSCSARLEGSTVEIKCNDAGSLSGELTMTFQQDRISGTTSGGSEFTAQRR